MHLKCISSPFISSPVAMVRVTGPYFIIYLPLRYCFTITLFQSYHIVLYQNITSSHYEFTICCVALRTNGFTNLACLIERKEKAADL
jgi:hypothetical protein